MEIDSYPMNNPNYIDERIITDEALLCIIICVIVFWINLFIIFRINIFQTLFTRFKQFFYRLPIIRKICAFFISSFQQQNNIDIQPRIQTDTCCICLNSITWEVASTCGHIFCGILDNLFMHIILKGNALFPYGKQRIKEN